MIKRHVKTGDEVAVLSGKWRGERGKVLAIVPAKDRLILELVGLSPEKQRQKGRRTMRKRPDQPQGGMVERAVSLHISNVGKKRDADVVANAPAAASTVKPQ